MNDLITITYFYNENANFKTYVDKYCKKHRTTPEIALKHKIVQEVYLYYKSVNG